MGGIVPAMEATIDRACKNGHRARRDARGRCSACLRDATAAYRAANPGCNREYGKIYYAANKAKRIAAAAAWAQANRDRMRELKAKWWAEHPNEMRLYARNRRARKAASADQHTTEDVADIAKAQRHRCAYCRTNLKVQKPQVDHIEPLVRGGSNGRRNLQLVCRPCNSSKRAKDPLDFARERGMLL